MLMRIEGKGHEKLFSKGFRKTTNNRMELLAVIAALESLKTDGHTIHLYTDSKYVSDAINKNWLSNWQKRAFKNVKNPDLWKRFIPLYERHKPTFHWLKGHAGHRENEICDQLAVKAYKEGVLEIDKGFEAQDGNSLF